MSVAVLPTRLGRLLLGVIVGLWSLPCAANDLRVITEWISRVYTWRGEVDGLAAASNRLDAARGTLASVRTAEPQRAAFSENPTIGEFETEDAFATRKALSDRQAVSRFIAAKTRWLTTLRAAEEAVTNAQAVCQTGAERAMAAEGSVVMAADKKLNLPNLNTNAEPICVTILPFTRDLPYFDRSTMSFRGICIGTTMIEDAVGGDSQRLYRIRFSGRTTFDVAADDLVSAERFKSDWTQGNCVVAIRGVAAMVWLESPILLEPERTEERTNWQDPITMLGVLGIASALGADLRSVYIPPYDPTKRVTIPARTRQGDRWHFDLRVSDVSLRTKDGRTQSGVRATAPIER